MSLDPLAYNYTAWSPYNYVAGNPISVIDPNGMAWSATNVELAAMYGETSWAAGAAAELVGGANDYFDSEGGFLGSGGIDSQIRIVSTDALKGAGGLKGEKLKKYYYNNSSVLGAERIESVTTISKIGQYYMDEHIECKGVEVCGLVGRGIETMAMTIKSGSMRSKGPLNFTNSRPVIGIGISPYGSISPLLGNKYNFVNILAHEYDHAQNTGFDGTTYSWYTTDIEGGDSAINLHLQSYLVQKNHSSFSQISPELSKHFNNSVNGYINKIKDPSLKDKWRSAF